MKRPRQWLVFGLMFACRVGAQLDVLPFKEFADFVSSSQRSMVFNETRPLGAGTGLVKALVLTAGKPIGQLADSDTVTYVRLQDVRKWTPEFTHLLIQCRNLLYLEIDGELTEFPDDLGALAALPRLKVLRISLKRPHRFPTALLSFPSLEGLDLSENSIADLPPEILVKLSKVRELILADNRIRLVSFVEAGRSALQDLDLSGNEILFVEAGTVFPAGLRNLDLSHNRLESWPIALRGCRNLETLDVGYNYFEDIPAEWLDATVVKKLKISSFMVPAPERERRKNISWFVYTQADAIK